MEFRKDPYRHVYSSHWEQVRDLLADDLRRVDTAQFAIEMAFSLAVFLSLFALLAGLAEWSFWLRGA